MIAIEFASDDDACLVLAALPAEARGTAYFVPAIGGVIGAPPLLYVDAEHEAAARSLADDLPAAGKASLIAYAADVRWRREVGGIVVAGVPVATDDRAKMMIVGARVAAMAEPEWSTVWHGADGGTYPIDAPTMITISAEVEAHVNSGFAIFAQVKAAIEAGTITSTAQVDVAFNG